MLVALSTSQEGATALMLASYCGHSSVVRVLLKAATINTTLPVRCRHFQTKFKIWCSKLPHFSGFSVGCCIKRKVIFQSLFGLSDVDLAAAVGDMIYHRHLQSCVGTRAKLGYAKFDAQLQKAFFVTTLCAIWYRYVCACVNMHLQYRCLRVSGPCDMSIHDSK